MTKCIEFLQESNLVRTIQSLVKFPNNEQCLHEMYCDVIYGNLWLFLDSSSLLSEHERRSKLWEWAWAYLDSTESESNLAVIFALKFFHYLFAIIFWIIIFAGFWNQCEEKHIFILKHAGAPLVLYWARSNNLWKFERDSLRIALQYHLFSKAVLVPSLLF